MNLTTLSYPDIFYHSLHPPTLVLNSLFINTRDIVLRFCSPVAGKVWGPTAPLEFGLLCYIKAAWLVILRAGDEGNPSVQPLSSRGRRGRGCQPRSRRSALPPAGRPSLHVISVSFHWVGRVSRDAGGPFQIYVYTVYTCGKCT